MNSISKLLKRESRNKELFLLDVSIFGGRYRRRFRGSYSNAFLITSMLKKI